MLRDKEASITPKGQLGEWALVEQGGEGLK